MEPTRMTPDHVKILRDALEYIKASVSAADLFDAQVPVGLRKASESLPSLDALEKELSAHRTALREIFSAVAPTGFEDGTTNTQALPLVLQCIKLGMEAEAQLAEAKILLKEVPTNRCFVDGCPCEYATWEQKRKDFLERTK